MDGVGDAAGLDSLEPRFRGTGSPRMPRGVPTSLQRRARRAVKAKKLGGRGLRGGKEEGEDRRGRTQRSGGGRVRGEAPPAPRSRVRGLHNPRATPQASAGPTLYDRKTPPTEAEMLLSPNPFFHPIFPLAFPPGFEPQERGVYGEKYSKRKGNLLFPSIHDHSLYNLLPEDRSPAPPAPPLSGGRGHLPATAGARPPRAGAGRASTARSPAAAADAEAAVAGRPPLPVST